MRLVACDLDGTIVGSDGLISPRTLAAFDACERAGVRVVFVTGRPVRWMAPIAVASGHRGRAICGNGAVLLDLAGLRVLRAWPLEPAAIRVAVDRLRSRLPRAVFALETTTGFVREPGFVPRVDAVPDVPAASLDQWLADQPVVIKLLCRVSGESADGLLAIAREVLAGVGEPVHSNSAGDLLEISAPGVSKGSALAAFTTELGITAAEVVAFGDMPNDVPMLTWAGTGYAMADGHPEAIGASDAVAPPFSQDGVAQILEALLTGRR